MAGKLVAGIETGGTKILARIVDPASDRIISEGKWSTSSAEVAVRDLLTFLGPAKAELGAIGIAAFGPLIVNPRSPDYGKMLATTKAHWAGSNLRARLSEELGVPVAVDTDVNVAAIAEQAAGAGEEMSSVAYVTVGTGIGAGLAVSGRTLAGALHPECGHLPVIRELGDNFPSRCPFHASCAEGLVSGPALRKRLVPGTDLADDPRLVELVAAYLGQLAATLVLAWSPQCIVWGGGVIVGAPLIPMIEQAMRDTLNGYGVGEAANQHGFCVPAMLENAGLEGAVLMARKLATQAIKKTP
jgi:fructokinase